MRNRKEKKREKGKGKRSEPEGPRFLKRDKETKKAGEEELTDQRKGVGKGERIDGRCAFVFSLRLCLSVSINVATTLMQVERAGGRWSKVKAKSISGLVDWLLAGRVQPGGSEVRKEER